MTCKCFRRSERTSSQRIRLSSDDSWHTFIKRIAASVQHITGQELQIKSVSDADSGSVVEEVEALRSKVEELSDEVSLLTR